MNMTYKVDIEMSATITDSVATEMIISAVEQQTGKTVLDIKPMYDGTKFNGFQLIFDTNTTSKVVTVKSTKKFIEEHFDK